MIKVFYFAPFTQDPTSYYRISGVLPFIQHKEIELKDISGTRDFTWATFSGCDVLIFQRGYSQQHYEIMRLAKDMGIRVIGDYDDNLLDVPKENPCFELYEQSQETSRKCLQVADEIWVTTQSIADRYKEFNQNIVIIPNAHNDFIFPVKNKKKFTKNNKVAYRGGASHAGDIYERLNDIVDTINNNPLWDFWFMGSGFEGLNVLTGDNYKTTMGLPVIQFYKSLHLNNANLFFYPLSINTFNQGKSNISILESAYSGSAFMGDRRLNEFNHPFVFDISGGIEQCFDAIKNDFDAIEKHHNMTWEWIMEERLLSKVNNLRIDRLIS